MLDKYNIISTSVSEAVERSLLMKKISFTLYSQSIQRAGHHIANMEITSCLPTRMHPV